MATYTIYNVASGLCLNIYGSNITSLSEHQAVTQYSSTGVTEQKWVLDADVLFYSGPIRSAVDTNFALNIYRDSNRYCDVYPISKNDEKDYKVTATAVGGKENTYYIKLSDSLHLTAPSLSSGARIGWAEYAGTEYQQWVFEETDDVTVDPIAPWSWSDSNGSASADQTKLAYKAITEKGAVSNFSYLVWNDLCDKAQECVNRSDGEWGTYKTAKMSGTDKAMTAVRFNALGNLLGLSSVSRGDKVMGSYFLSIATALNNWISTLNN